MRKHLLLLMLFIALSASADNFSYLAFKSSDGTVQTVSVASLTLTFSNGVVTATNSEGSKTFTLADLSMMYFSVDQEGTNSIESVFRNVEGQVTVYSLTGVKMGSYASIAEARGALKSGIYVVSAGGKSYKMNLK
jgi:hypothetical protein